MLTFREECLAAPQSALGSLLFAQIEHESDTFAPTSFEECAAEKYRHSAAIFPEVLLLEGLKHAGRLQISYRLFGMATPFGRCQVRPAYATVGEIVTIVLHHAEKGFGG